MILIVSKEKLEKSTEDVIDWLDHYGIPFLRVNGDALYNNNDCAIEISEGAQSFALNGTLQDVLKAGPFGAAWYRRWGDERHIENMLGTGIKNSQIYMLTTNVNGDFFSLRRFFLSSVRAKSWLNDPNTASVNKLELLVSAKNAGLAIPDTIVCSNKNVLKVFCDRHPRVISKDLAFPFYFFEDNLRYASYTNEIKEPHLLSMSESFKPSLFQELIEKQYEIRSFFLDGQFYSMAIFSQADPETEIDFRHYNMKKPNRTVPYQLDGDVEDKLRVLMRETGLNSGSIDLIMDHRGRYVFLEVNPVGQFGMTSYPCNYHLEKKIAQYLIEKSNGERN